MISGAVKEAGLLVLLNKYIYSTSGNYPFGETFNARIASHFVPAANTTYDLGTSSLEFKIKT